MHFYSTLAKFYDKIYHYLDYQEQVNCLIKLHRDYCLSGGKYFLDICCGTGSHAGRLTEAGFSGLAVDNSKEMLEALAKKYPNLPHEKQDLMDLHVKQPVDLAFCLFNSVLYSESSGGLEKVFTDIHAFLSPGGIFVFDLVDKRVGTDKDERVYNYREDGLFIALRPRWELVDDSTWNLHIKFEVNDDGFTDCHKMLAITIPEVKQMLENIGFEVFCFKKDFERLIPLEDNDGNSLIVARKR